MLDGGWASGDVRDTDVHTEASWVESINHFKTKGCFPGAWWEEKAQEVWWEEGNRRAKEYAGEPTVHLALPPSIAN